MCGTREGDADCWPLRGGGGHSDGEICKYQLPNLGIESLIDWGPKCRCLPHQDAAADRLRVPDSLAMAVISEDAAEGDDQWRERGLVWRHCIGDKMLIDSLVCYYCALHFMMLNL